MLVLTNTEKTYPSQISTLWVKGLRMYLEGEQWGLSVSFIKSFELLLYESLNRTANVFRETINSSKLENILNRRRYCAVNCPEN